MNIGKTLMISGIVIFILGLILSYSDKIPFLGKLPGDFTIKKENFTFYFPLASSIIVSIIISLIIYLINKFRD